MVFVKTMLQKNKDGSVRKHFYLAENRREGDKIKIKLLGRISEEEALAFRRDRSRDRDETSTLETPIPTIEGRDSSHLLTEVLDQGIDTGKFEGKDTYKVRKLFTLLKALVEESA